MSDLDEKEFKRREAIVVSDHGGIFPVFEAFYLEALSYAAGAAVEAFGRYDAAIEKSEEAAAIVANLHEALTHIAAVSRFFWPSRTDGIPAHRATRLREALGISADSPLAARELRNTLEHFDERLDRFLLNDLNGYIFPGPLVGPASLADEELGNIFRLVDPEAEVFVLFGKKYPFGKLREAVASVHHLVTEATAHGGRLPSSNNDL